MHLREDPSPRRAGALQADGRLHQRVKVRAVVGAAVQAEADLDAPPPELGQPHDAGAQPHVAERAVSRTHVVRGDGGDLVVGQVDRVVDQEPRTEGADVGEDPDGVVSTLLGAFQDVGIEHDSEVLGGFPVRVVEVLDGSRRVRGDLEAAERNGVDEFLLHLRDQRRVGFRREHRVGEPHSGSGQGPYVALDQVVREDVHPVHEGGHPRLDGVEGGEAYEAVQGLGGEPAPLGVGTSCEPAEQVPVGTAPADHRLPEVGVGIDEPRHDQLARSVHDPGTGRGPQARADGGDGAVSHQDVGVLEGAEGAAAEGRVHGEDEGGAAQQDRRADRDVWAFGAGGDAEGERSDCGQAEAGEDFAAVGGRRRSGG